MANCPQKVSRPIANASFISVFSRGESGLFVPSAVSAYSRILTNCLWFGEKWASGTDFILFTMSSAPPDPPDFAAVSFSTSATVL